MIEVNRELFEASEPNAVGVLPFLELQWEDTHADQIGSVDPLVGFSNHDFHTLEVWSFGGPVSR